MSVGSLMQNPCYIKIHNISAFSHIKNIESITYIANKKLSIVF